MHVACTRARGCVSLPAYERHRAGCRRGSHGLAHTGRTQRSTRARTHARTHTRFDEVCHALSLQHLQRLKSLLQQLPLLVLRAASASTQCDHTCDARSRVARPPHVTCAQPRRHRQAAPNQPTTQHKQHAHLPALERFLVGHQLALCAPGVPARCERKPRTQRGGSGGGGGCSGRASSCCRRTSPVLLLCAAAAAASQGLGAVPHDCCIKRLARCPVVRQRRHQLPAAAVDALLHLQADRRHGSAHTRTP
jgi:hypothetical protein